MASKGNDVARASDLGVRRRPVAVIDIGSNSVRLVVYNGEIRTPIPLYNEKVICALGRGLEKTGTLNSQGVKLSYDTVARFVAIARSLGASRIDALATAAVRDAVDGEAFAKALERRCDIKVQILTGKQEARRSALGVLCGIPQAEGIVADLGGGSMELVHVGGGDMSEHTTLPLGLLRLPDASHNDRTRAIGIVNKALAEHKWITKSKDQTIYAVGGAWRTLARVCIAQMNYPLHVLDNFTLERPQAIALFEVISRLSTKSLEHITGVSKSRLATLPLAAAVLERLLEVMRPRTLVFSIYGMREGQFYKSLPDNVRKLDPLISLAEEIARTADRPPQAGHETFSWMSPLFKDESLGQKRLRLAASLLRDVWWAEHPDYRGEQAFLRVLRLPYLGLGHEDRAGLALALYFRHGNSDPREPAIKHAMAQIDDRRLMRVQTIGLALRLSYALSAGAVDVLERTTIEIDRGKLILTVPDSDPLFRLGSFLRRLERLAQHLNLEPVLERV